jgi:nucleotide-binding universal stress UspA family protein
MSHDADRPLRRVLVPLDGSVRSHRVLPSAVALARQAGASLELLSVHAAGGGWEQHLQSLADDLSLKDVDTTLVSTGPADEAIAELADRVPGTIVCMATRARTGLSGVLVGSVAARVVRRVRSPVMLIGPQGWSASHPPPAYSQLVVCLSGSERSERLVPVAKAWARQLDVRIALVHGHLEPPDADRLRPIATRLEALAEESFRAPGTIGVHLASGSTPAVGIQQHLDQHPGSLALVSIRTGSRLERLLPGGFTTELLQDAPAPVVTITP